MIDFIASQLGIPTSNARILFDQWLDTAMNTLSEGKPVTLDGLGTFTYENNELKFTPDAGLELDVNRAYAGLEPIPEEKLGPAKLTESDFDDPFMEIIAPKYLDLNRDAEPKQEEAAEEVNETQDAMAVEHIEEPDVAMAAEHIEEPDVAMAAEHIEEPDVAMAAEHEPAPKPIPLASTSPNIMPWLIAVVILAVVLVGGWYAVQWYGNTLETEMAGTGTETVPTPIQNEAVAIEPTSPIAKPEFGLRGAMNPLEGRVYAIIVHSLPTEAQSQTECAKIVALGLRCSVVPAERNGAATFRVGIGQFESVDMANRSVIELPEQYQTPGNFFITRIQ